MAREERLAGSSGSGCFPFNGFLVSMEAASYKTVSILLYTSCMHEKHSWGCTVCLSALQWDGRIISQIDDVFGKQ